jgi:hypothetical protein
VLTQPDHPGGVAQAGVDDRDQFGRHDPPLFKATLER